MTLVNVVATTFKWVLIAGTASLHRAMIELGADVLSSIGSLHTL